MGNRRPKSEQLDKRFQGRVGLSLTELLVVMAISSIVLFTVTMISTLSLRSAALTNASMAIDEEVTKLHTSLRSIVSRQWTFLQSVLESDDISGGGQIITLVNNIPIKEDPGWVGTTSTIEFLEEERQLVHYFKDRNGNVVSNVIANNIEAFLVSLEENYIQYSATLAYYSRSSSEVPIVKREVKGAVRFY